MKIDVKTPHVNKKIKTNEKAIFDTFFALIFKLEKNITQQIHFALLPVSARPKTSPSKMKMCMKDLKTAPQYNSLGKTKRRPILAPAITLRPIKKHSWQIARK